MWTYSQSENQFIQINEPPKDAVSVSDEVVARAHAAVAEGLPFVVLGVDDITVAPSPAHVWYVNAQRWIAYIYEYSPSTGGLYPCDMLGDYNDLPKDLIKITGEVYQSILYARECGLGFVISDSGEKLQTAPSVAHEWAAKTQEWLLNSDKQAALDEAARKAAVPQVVTMRQARLALLDAGLLDLINSAFDAADAGTKIEWEFASEIRRDWAGLGKLQALLNLNDERVDELFTLAATL